MIYLTELAKSKSRRFAAGAICFICGVAAALLLGLDRAALFYILIFSLTGLTALIFFWENLTARVIFLVLFWLSLGVMRLILSEPAVSPGQLRFYHGRLVEITGVILAVDQTADKQKIILETRELKNLLAADASKLPVTGKIWLMLAAYPEFHYGEVLKFTCSPEPPATKFFARRGVWSICYPERLTVAERDQGNYWLTKLFVWRESLFSLIDRLWPEPAASLISGLLLGARADFSSSLHLAFNRSGLAHLVAVSGYNVAIIAFAFWIILRWLSIPRRRVFLVLTLLLIVFVLLTGASAATVRAAVMAWLLFLAQSWGKPRGSWRVIIFTAAAMLAINPYYLIDIGWQLSFLAVLGLIYLAPFFDKFWPKNKTKGKDKPPLQEILSATLGAITATAPLIAYYFGQFSVVAPLVNVLILPIVPLTMLLGAAAIFGASLWWPLGAVLAWPAWLFLNYIARLAEFFSSLKFASVNVPALPLALIVVIYLIMVWLVVKHQGSGIMNHESGQSIEFLTQSTIS